MVLNLNYVSEFCWIEVCKKVKESIVFLDECSGECLHWHGGIRRLQNAGAVRVKNFSSFEGGDKNEKKAIFLVANPLMGPSRMILRDIISNSFFEHCILITPCSPAVFHLAAFGDEKPHEPSALHQLEIDILQWMKNDEFMVEIFHSYSYGIIPLTDYLFVIPAFDRLMPCFDEDITSFGPANTKISDWELELFPLELQACATYLVSNISSLLSQLSLREDIYCLGPFSNLISSLLQKSPTSALRSKSAGSSTSLVLVDRTLDVCGPLTFGSADPPLDLLKQTLPVFPGQTIDLAVDMSQLFTSYQVSRPELIPPGCLHEPRGPSFDWLLSKTSNEILKCIAKEVCSAVKRKQQDFSLTDLEKIIMEEFSSDLHLMKNHSGLIQLTLGLTQALKSGCLEKTKLLKSFQMILLQTLSSHGCDEAARQILDLVNKRHERGFELEHILYILTFFYSFIGEKYEVDSDTEALIFSALRKAIIEDKGNDSADSKLDFDAVGNIDNFCDLVSRKLKSLKTCRKHLFKYRDVTIYQDSLMPLEYQSVLVQLLQDILNPLKIGIPDLRHKPNLSVRDNLASRFSMFLNTTRTHITDSDSIIIFFIGGVTGHEVKTIKTFFKHFQKPVIIGSTSLLSPADLINKLYFNNGVKPFS